MLYTKTVAGYGLSAKKAKGGEDIKNQFLYPDTSFSPIPFWFWNGDLREDELKRQIEDFYDKGVNGFVIHPRMGIPNNLEYMSERFLNLVKFAVRQAAQLKMQVVLYDEAMYPSGSAHGQVAATNIMFKSHGLRKEKDKDNILPDELVIYEENSIYYVLGYTNGTIRGIHFGEDDREEFAPKSADLLNKEAVKCFIKLTHDKYFEAMGEFFGNTIIGIFTDEPCFLGRNVNKDILPWSFDFLDFYIKNGGRYCDIPKLWENGIEKNHFYKLLTLRIEETYYLPISKWCEKHSIALMGHPEKSDDIALLKYFHIPGQDLVLRFVSPENEKGLKGIHTTQAKCSADTARHTGKKRNSNECFGACNKDNIPWNFSGADMKWYIDWLCVRGVNLLIPHAFYYSVEGKRKFERPPDVGPNNIWWDDYKIISTYIKRLCWLMTDCVNTAKIAVLCGDDGLDWEETATLYQNQVEFNYLQDCYLIKDNIKHSCICVKDNCYQILLVPKNIELTDEQQKLLLGENVKVVKNAIDALNIVSREIQTETYTPDLRFSNVIKENKNFYLFVNEGENAIETTVFVYKTGLCEYWYPFSGEIKQVDAIETEEKYLKIKLRLQRRESVILFLDESQKISVFLNKEKQVIERLLTDEPFIVSEEELNSKIILNIDREYEYVQLFVNGNLVGTRMWSPFLFDISSFVSVGENEISVFTKESKAIEYGFTDIAKTF